MRRTKERSNSKPHSHRNRRFSELPKGSWAKEIKHFQKPEHPKLPAENSVTIATNLSYEQAYGRPDPAKKGN